jgi:3-deoxy-manno-octulosonate cytidylyltransferase (CMP-KDO synthetase)
LEKIVKLPEGRLERCEKLEQLRALENGIKIYVHLTKANTIGIDTPEDLEEAKKQLEKGIKV